MTTSPHTRSRRHIRQASGFPRFDEFLGPRLALPTFQLDHPHGIWHVKTKLPHRVGETRNPRRRFWRQQGNIWPTRKTQPEAGYAQLARHAASGTIPSTRHHCLPVQPTRNIRMAGHVAGHQLQKPRPRDDTHTSRWSRRGGCQYLFFVTTAVIGRVSDAELAAVPARLTRRPQRSWRPYWRPISFPLGSEPSFARFTCAHCDAARCRSKAAALLRCRDALDG